jgi:Zn-dependent protease with chaperone function
MDNIGLVPIISAIGWLVLAGAALASFRLSWQKTLRYAFVWAAIFAFATLVISVMTGEKEPSREQQSDFPRRYDLT